jgi:hypothetical protein
MMMMSETTSFGLVLLFDEGLGVPTQHGTVVVVSPVHPESRGTVSLRFAASDTPTRIRNNHRAPDADAVCRYANLPYANHSTTCQESP